MMVGVVLLSAPWSTRFTISAGETIALVNGFFFALYLILVRKETMTYKPLTVTAGFFAAAALLLVVFAFFLAPFCDCGRFSLSRGIDQWPALLGLGLVGTAMPFVSWNIGLKHMQASVLGILNLLTRVVATILSIVVLGQMVVANQIIGGAMMLLSVVNLRR